MQIQLRQSEIETALKQFIVKQGINLDGKAIGISFTAGRKDTGLTADISIEEPGALPQLPSDNPEDAAQTKPVLAVVSNTAAPVATPAQQSEAVAANETKTEDASATKTGSLFG